MDDCPPRANCNERNTLDCYGYAGIMFTCGQCGGFFLSRGTYCSSACRQKAYRRRRDEWPVQPIGEGEVAAMVGRLRRHVQRLDDAANRGVGVRLNSTEAKEVAVVLRREIDGLIGS
jgi:hypothetical protein